MSAQGFRVVSEEDACAPDKTPVSNVGTRMVWLGLRALSERATVSLASILNNIMTIGLVASAWVLWRGILANPTATQLVAVGGYALFALAIDVARRKRHV